MLEMIFPNADPWLSHLALSPVLPVSISLALLAHKGWEEGEIRSYIESSWWFLRRANKRQEQLSHGPCVRLLSFSQASGDQFCHKQKVIEVRMRWSNCWALKANGTCQISGSFCLCSSSATLNLNNCH